MKICYTENSGDSETSFNFELIIKFRCSSKDVGRSGKEIHAEVFATRTEFKPPQGCPSSLIHALRRTVALLLTTPKVLEHVKTGQFVSYLP